MNILYSDLKRKTIIITGGLGFLAAQFEKAFEDNLSNVIILDTKNCNKKNFFKCDITKEDQLRAICLKIKKKYN
jgi:dTDP-4-dehydrorhamnose reductase